MSDSDPALPSRRELLSLPLAAATLGLLTPSLARAATGDPLSSWNDSRSKSAILDFVARVTKEGGSDFVAAEAWGGLTTARYSRLTTSA